MNPHPTPPAVRPISHDPRRDRIRRLVDECLERQTSDEPYSEESVLGANQDLMPELAVELHRLRLFGEACQRAGLQKMERAPGEIILGLAPGLSIRCPHCHCRLQLPTEDCWADIRCASCQESFHLLCGDSALPDPEAPWQLGHFEMIELLGTGGFGTVWKARDQELGRLVAVKFPCRGQLNRAESEQFLREARAAASLRHPHIVPVHEVGREADRIYIVSELIDGPSLAQWLATSRMSSVEAAVLCQKIALALHHAHSAGIVHRDLKPANILLDDHSQPYLTDFGLARHVAEQTTVTLDGQVHGTPAYMSPEQARGGAHAADGRTDVYSLGVILYELLVGQLPFCGQSGMLIRQILEDDPPSPRRLEAGVPRDLESICLKCLEKPPSRRYATALELADDLGRFLRREPTIARPISRLQRTGRWCRRNPVIASLTAAVALLLLTTAVVATHSALRFEAAAQSAYWQQYLSDIHLATRAWNDADLQTTVAALERYREPIERDDPRGFEWYYLWRQVENARRTPGLTFDNQVRMVAVSPDGKLGAIGDERGRLVLWRLADRKPIWDIQAHGFRTGAAEFSRDGKTLSTGGGVPGAVSTWDVASGRLVRTFEVHGGNLVNVLSLAYSPDGSRLAAGDDGHSATVWDVATGKIQFTVTGHTDKVSWVGWLNQETLLTGSWDQTVREWRAVDGTLLRVIARLADQPAGATFAISPDRTLVAAGGQDGLIRIVDVGSGVVRTSLAGHRDRVRGVQFSSDGQLASVSADRQALLWDIATGKPRVAIKAHSSALTCLAFTPDGSQLVTGSQDGTVKLTDTRLIDAHDPICRGHADFVFDVAFNRQGDRLVSASSDGTVRIWTVATGSEERQLAGSPRSFHGVACSPRDSTIVASSADDGQVTAWNGSTGEQIWSVAADFPLSGSLQFSPDGQIVASVSRGGLVRFWRAGDGEPAGTIRGGDFAFLRGGDELAMVDENQQLSIVNWRTRKTTRKLPGKLGKIAGVAASPDGRYVAAGGRSPSVVVWDVERGQLLHTLDYAEEVNGLAFSADGRLLATAGTDQRVCLWDVATGAERAAFWGHAGWVESVAFSPDGTLLATASDDRTIRLWRAASPADVAASPRR